MAQTIILKKSAVAGKVPQASDLEIGEVAINMADRILYFKDSSGEVKSIKGEYSGGGGVEIVISTDEPESPYEGMFWAQPILE